jgi:hypothetical protein
MFPSIYSYEMEQKTKISGSHVGDYETTSRILRRVLSKKLTDVSEAHTTSIIMDHDDDKSSKHLWNVG